MYGNALRINSNGITVIIDGWWFTARRDLITHKWIVSLTKNLWRKTGKPCPTRAQQAETNRLIRGSMV